MKGINDIGQTVQQHIQKVIQMHLFARNFACQLEQKIVEKHSIGAFGKVPRYRKIYYGEDDKGECVTLEEFIDGKFTKYLNNTGDCCVDETDVMGQKAQCLTHFSNEKSEKKLMLLDIQEVGMNYSTQKLLLMNCLMVVLRYFIVLVTCHRWQLTSLSQATNVMSSVTLLGSKVVTLIKYVSTTKLGTGIHLFRKTEREKYM